MKKKNVEYYLKLPYTIQVIRETDPDEQGFVARVTELPGCITQADTMAELEGMIADAMRAWLTVALEEGLEIPEPHPDEEYSGKFVVRIPRSLHRKLVQDAENEGVSLNQLVNTYLAGAAGYKNQVAFSDANMKLHSVTQ